MLINYFLVANEHTWLKWVVPFCLGMMFFSTSEAQTTISKRVVLEQATSDSVYFLGDWVLSESIQVQMGEAVLSSSCWKFEAVSGTLKIEFECIRNTFPIVVEYEVLPISIPRSLQRNSLRTMLYDSSGTFLENKDLEPPRKSGFDSDLKQSGSLSRGIIVGSNQDFALESGLRFQLSGQLTDDIQINASLTDRSIPIQPDGTTQNLREFDKVLIQLRSNRASLDMGDVDVAFTNSTFARLQRRLQGAVIGYNNQEQTYDAAVSVVRGTFKSIQFLGEDGVQGPYRLTGREGEAFVIILAGTERVYINGVQVQRGEENDYIIDYGLGEVFFTSNILIKDETRISIEYEYIDQNFNRTMIAGEGKDAFYNGKLEIGATIIRQSDGDALLSQQSLSQTDIDRLSEVGDRLEEARVSGVQTEGISEDVNVRYAQIDTTFEGVTYQIFKNIPESPNSDLVVRFTNVGLGNGSYIRTVSSVNGLLYEWVGPGNGEYEPFRQLPAPQLHQMVSLYSTYKIHSNIQLHGEFATSMFDLNRFSSLDDADNTDISYLGELSVLPTITGLGVVEGRFSRRFSGKNFKFFERTRDIEFNRIWNVNELENGEETINQSRLELHPTKESTIAAEFGWINREGLTNIRQGFELQKDGGGNITGNYTQDYVLTDDTFQDREGEWFRQLGKIEYAFGKGFSPFLEFEQERRNERSIENQQLQSTSWSFYEVGPGLGYKSSKLDLFAAVNFREEERPLNDELQKESVALQQRYGATIRFSDYLDTRNQVTIRRKSITEAFEEQGEGRRRGFLVKSVTNYESPGSRLNGQFFYEVNTQRRAQLQEAYIEVGAELGQYVWQDSNEDGVEQIEEFFPELSPNEGTYVLRLLPSDILLPVIDVRARLRNEWKILDLNRNNESSGSAISGLTWVSRLEVLENSTSNAFSDIYLLRLETFRNDSTTLSGRLAIDQELNLEWVTGSRTSLSYAEMKSLNNRSADLQRSETQNWLLRNTISLSEASKLTIDGGRSKNALSSSLISARNYNIRSLFVTGGFTYRLNRSWESGFSLSYSDKIDHSPEIKAKANIYKFKQTHRAYLFRNIQTNGQLEVRHTRIDGPTNSINRFELSEGTGSGTQLIWALAGSYRVSNLVRLSLNYDGRTVRERQDIHTIKLVVSAIF